MKPRVMTNNNDKLETDHNNIDETNETSKLKVYNH